MIELGKKYLVRCKDSGVFFGTVVAVEGQTAKIEDIRKVYEWHGANCLEQLSQEGTKKGHQCRLTMKATNIVMDAIQFLPCNENAIELLEAIKEWKE